MITHKLFEIDSAFSKLCSENAPARSFYDFYSDMDCDLINLYCEYGDADNFPDILKEAVYRFYIAYDIAKQATTTDIPEKIHCRMEEYMHNRPAVIELGKAYVIEKMISKCENDGMYDNSRSLMVQSYLTRYPVFSSISINIRGDYIEPGPYWSIYKEYIDVPVKDAVRREQIAPLLSLLFKAGGTCKAQLYPNEAIGETARRKYTFLVENGDISDAPISGVDNEDDILNDARKFILFGA
ncbi:MAG: hypothetical protein K6B41_07095 [Butyrivibrio sp.]|nr:hypothetical protein [Butyrivibrio sp.]